MKKQNRNWNDFLATFQEMARFTNWLKFMKNLLLVDDNDKYADLLEAHYNELGFKADRAVDAAEGLSKFRQHGLDHYPMIVTDVTMETQTSGLGMLKKIKKEGYAGTIIIASTGFDVITAKTLTKLFLRSTGVHYMIPKTTVLKKKLVYYPISFFTKPIFEFPGLIQ